jgi:hypothetical protein
MTASANNLVKSVLNTGKTKPKLLVQRGLTPREMLQSSTIRIYRELVTARKQICLDRQREGRTRTAMTKPIQEF